MAVAPFPAPKPAVQPERAIASSSRCQSRLMSAIVVRRYRSIATRLVLNRHNSELDLGGCPSNPSSHAIERP